MSLIVMEGLDGSGKGTQAGLLEETLKARGPVKRICFPDYASDSSALVRMYLNGAFGQRPEDVNAYGAGAFYAVDRYASYLTHWKGDYLAGTVILADRYTTSNLVYQMTKLPREQWEGYITWTEEFEYEKLGLPRPDLVIYLDMPVEVSQKLLLRRYQGDGSKRDLHERDIHFLKSCGECARYAAGRLGWKVIPCAKEGEPLSVEEIHRAVVEAAAGVPDAHQRETPENRV